MKFISNYYFIVMINKINLILNCIILLKVIRVIETTILIVFCGFFYSQNGDQNTK